MIQSTAHFNQPPPTLVNLSVPPPMPGVQTHFPPPRFQDVRNQGHRPHFFQPFRPFARPGPGQAQDEFDGKRLRKSVMRKTVDYNAALIKMLENRVWQRDFRDRRALQPDVTYCPDMEPPPSYVDNPINSVTTRFVKTATNKMRCPIFCMAWTPEGRRLVTGASSGEFTLWNGLTFNFETILQAHDSPVRTMVWSHNDVWMVTGDHSGYVKYWQSNMNNVKMFQAHKEALRGLSFAPSDHKFVTCSDDGTLRIWDFLRCHEERILRGHGADVKCVHWHPQKSLIISGSKDNQQPVKLWDAKSGQALATLHAHKSTVMDVKWNANGNWVVTASRDHLLKLFDIRNLSQEVQTFRGHKKEASSVAWHPYHEGLFASGGSDGAILFWHVGTDKEVGAIEQAHDSIVWTLAWHPLGHILCSGSNDHTSKFWTRNRPGDAMRDKYNLNTLPPGLSGLDGDIDLDEPTAMIPGMGPEDRVSLTEEIIDSPSETPTTIPGLDLEGVDDKLNKPFHKKVPYSKPIPRNFMAQWNETNKSEDKDENSDEDDVWQKNIKVFKDPLNPLNKAITKLIESAPIPGIIPLSEINAQAVIVYGKILPVDGNPSLAEAISQGSNALNRLITSGDLEELQDFIPHLDEFEGQSEEGSDVEDSQGDKEINNGSIGLDQSLNPLAMLSTSDSTKTTSTTTSSSSSLLTKRVRKSRFSDIEEKSSSPIVKNPQTGMPSLSTLELSSASQNSDPRFLARPSNIAGTNQDQDMRSGNINISGSGSMGPNSGTRGPSPHNFGSYSDMSQRPHFPGGPQSQIWDRKRRWESSDESSSNLSNSNIMNMNNMGPNMNNINSNNMGPNNMSNLGPNNMNKLPHNSMNIGPSKMNMGPNSMGPNNMGQNMGPNMGPNSHGPNMGPNSHGPNMGPNSMVSNMGHNSMGSNMGPTSIGHNNMGPNSMGHNMGPNNMGPGSMGPNNMGPNNMGPNNMGPNNMGPNNMGLNNMGSNNMGPNNMGPNNMGPNNMGPNNMGHNNMGPNNMGPNNMGMMNKNNYGFQGYGGGFGPPPPRGPWNKQDENMMRGPHYPGPRGPRFEPRGTKMRPSGPMPRGPPPHFRPPRMQGPPRGPWQGNR